MNFNREKARQVLMDSALGTDLDVVLDGLEECIEPDGWNAIMRILGTYYPESIFPQRSVDADWGNGPQVVSLLRLLNAAEAKRARIRAICDRYHAEHWGWDEIRAVLDDWTAETL